MPLGEPGKHPGRKWILRPGTHPPEPFRMCNGSVQDSERSCNRPLCRRPHLRRAGPSHGRSAAVRTSAVPVLRTAAPPPSALPLLIRATAAPPASGPNVLLNANFSEIQLTRTMHVHLSWTKLHPTAGYVFVHLCGTPLVRLSWTKLHPTAGYVFVHLCGTPLVRLSWTKLHPTAGYVFVHLCGTSLIHLS